MLDSIGTLLKPSSSLNVRWCFRQFQLGRPYASVVGDPDGQRGIPSSRTWLESVCCFGRIANVEECGVGDSKTGQGRRAPGGIAQIMYDTKFRHGRLHLRPKCVLGPFKRRTDCLWCDYPSRPRLQWGMLVQYPRPQIRTIGANGALPPLAVRRGRSLSDGLGTKSTPAGVAARACGYAASFQLVACEMPRSTMLMAMRMAKLMAKLELV